MRRPGSRAGAAALCGLALCLGGCTPSIETGYGRSRSPSVNGTGVFAGMLRERGHEIRVAVRLTDTLRDWADVVVRFSPRPGAPDRDEARWYDAWLDGGSGRRVLYVPRDHDALPDYWSVARAQLPKNAEPRLRERVEEAFTKANAWRAPILTPAKVTAAPDDWFAVETGRPATVCRTLEGPWAEGVDAGAAALPNHDSLKVQSEAVLLSGDDTPLVIGWARHTGSEVLVVSNGSFLLNAALANHARRPLAERAADWVGLPDDDEDETSAVPRRVAFVEGSNVVGEEAGSPSVFHLLTVFPFGWVGAQAFALALAACLARAPRLGRARAEAPSGAERPAAHPEALGSLLARTGQAGEARSLLETYRHSRHGSPGRKGGRPKWP